MQCERDGTGEIRWIALQQTCAESTDPEAGSGADTAPAAADAGGTAAAGGPGIRILWAHYGRDGRNCDAHPPLSKRCDGKAICELVVGPDTLCGDPFPEHPKLLTVFWQCGDGELRLRPPIYGADAARVEMSCTQP